MGCGKENQPREGFSVVGNVVIILHLNSYSNSNPGSGSDAPPALPHRPTGNATGEVDSPGEPGIGGSAGIGAADRVSAEMADSGGRGCARLGAEQRTGVAAAASST